MSKTKLVGRRQSRFGRRLFGLQEVHPLHDIFGKVNSSDWTTWREWFADWSTEVSYRKRAMMLVDGIVFGCPNRGDVNQSCYALAFYLAVADFQDIIQGGMRGSEDSPLLQRSALEGLRKWVFKKESLWKTVCVDNEVVVDSLLYFFVCWPDWNTLNFNIPSKPEEGESGEFREWVVSWVKELWKKCNTEGHPLSVENKERRRMLLVLLVRLRAFGVGPMDLSVYYLSPIDLTWLTKMLGKNERLDKSIVRGPRSDEVSYLAFLIEWGRSVQRAKASIAKNPPRY